jgi:hypothetical protein
MLCRTCYMSPHRTAIRRTSSCFLPDVMSSWKQHRAELDVLVCCAASEGHSEDRQTGRQAQGATWKRKLVYVDSAKWHTPIKEVVCWLVTACAEIRVRMSCGGKWCWLWRWSYSCILKSHRGCGGKAPHISAPSGRKWSLSCVSRFNAGVKFRCIHIMRQGLLPESLQMR